MPDISAMSDMHTSMNQEEPEKWKKPNHPVDMFCNHPTRWQLVVDLEMCKRDKVISGALSYLVPDLKNALKKHEVIWPILKKIYPAEVR